MTGTPLQAGKTNAPVQLVRRLTSESDTPALLSGIRFRDIPERGRRSKLREEGIPAPPSRRTVHIE